jgi:hypothetical protein
VASDVVQYGLCICEDAVKAMVRFTWEFVCKCVHGCECVRACMHVCIDGWLGGCGCAQVCVL